MKPMKRYKNGRRLSEGLVKWRRYEDGNDTWTDVPKEYQKHHTSMVSYLKCIFWREIFLSASEAHSASTYLYFLFQQKSFEFK